MPDPCEYIVEQLDLVAVHRHGLSALMEESFSIHNSSSFTAQSFMRETLSLNGGVFANKITAKNSLAETLELVQDYVIKFRVPTMAETLTLTDAWVGTQVILMRETLSLTSAFTPIGKNKVTVGETISLIDLYRGGLTNNMAEVLVLTNPNSYTYLFRKTIAEVLTIVDAYPTISTKVTKTMGEVLTLVNATGQRVTARAAVAETLSLIDDFWFRSADQIAWQMNTETSALSWNTNFSFDSITQFGNKIFLASKDGLYLLGGNTDNSVSINSTVKTGFMDFADHRTKRIDGVFFGLRGTDMKLGLDVFGDSVTHTYTMPSKTTSSPGSNRIVPGKGLKSRYWRMTFTNVNGGDFDVDNVEFDFAISSTRRL